MLDGINCDLKKVDSLSATFLSQQIMLSGKPGGGNAANPVRPEREQR